MRGQFKSALDPEPLRKLLAGGDPEEYVQSISGRVDEQFYRELGLSESLIKRLIEAEKHVNR